MIHHETTNEKYQIEKKNKNDKRGNISKKKKIGFRNSELDFLLE